MCYKDGEKLENIILASTKSLTLTNKIPNGNININNISVGDHGIYTYSSFLFFDISTIPKNAVISNAEIVLFKTDNSMITRKKVFIYIHFLTPLVITPPTRILRKLTISLRVSYPITSKISVTANVTKMVSLWFKNSNLNRGIILCKKNNNFITNFGSAICKDSSLTPFIKVTYSIKHTIVIPEKHTNHRNECDYNIENHTQMKIIYYPCPCNCDPNHGIPTPRQVKVIGIIAPMAIYEAIVRLVITRIGTGDTDNYYVTDEYDNSASNIPLAIDKTYNIAVLPQANPGDTEDIAFYGAYKGNLELYI